MGPYINLKHRGALDANNLTIYGDFPELGVF